MITAERNGMQKFKARVQELADKYESRLAEKGIKVSVSKRYFESEVIESSGSGGNGAILDSAFRARDRKREKDQGYNYQRNRYHCIVLSVLPLEKKNSLREDSKDYSFMLRKVERAHIGQEPRRIAYAEDKLLGRIEKRILKILKKAERQSPEDVCKNRLPDALRYTFSGGYGYKKSYCGKDKLTWDIIFASCFAAAVIVLILAGWIFSELK